MDSLFSGCSAIQRLDLGNFITNSETSMNNMFSGCDSLKKLDISGFNITSYDILNELNKLEFINIYKAKNYDVNDINYISRDLYICQKEKNIQNLNIENKCGYYNIDKRKFDSTNLIIIYFNKNVEYKSGFINGIESRNTIDFLVNDDKIDINEPLSIHKGKKIEIYVNKETISLKSFFDSDLDPNMLYLKSIDFTFFDSSKITNMENLFKGCSELEEIDFTNFNTSLVSSMGLMFSGCSKLKELDISFFDTSSLIDMHDMFYGCKQLKVIDLYGINMKKVITAFNIFKNNGNLKYINLLNVKDSYINITESMINRKDDLIVCQNDNIIINTKATYKCCYYNTENGKCESDHYMILFYKNEVLYKSGFSFGTNNNANVEFRDNLDFLVINRKKIQKNESLYIKPHEKVELYFSYNISTLDNYFSLNYDDNAKNIGKIELLAFISSTIINMSHLFERWNSLEPINLNDFNYSSVKDTSYMFSECSLESIDLSKLETPQVEDISHIFEGCSSLKYVNLSNLKTEKVEDMSYMFSECAFLESIDLSNFSTPNVLNMTKMFYKNEKLVYLNLSTFNTDKVKDMSYIFYDMKSLKYLDISNFNMGECISFNDMFSNISNIRFINIINLNNDKIISKTFNKRNDFFYVCESFTIIDNINAYNCCEYNMENEQCGEILLTTIVTTIPKSFLTTTFNTIKTTFPILASTIINTIPEIINNTIPTTIVDTLTKEPTSITENIATITPKTTVEEDFPSSIEKTNKGTNIQTSENEQPLSTIKVDNKTENITVSSSTISSNNLQSTIINTTFNTEKTESTIPEIIKYTTYIDETIKEITKNEVTNVVLLGFSQLRLFSSYFSFYMHLISNTNLSYINQILFPMTIIYNRNRRRLLKESQVNCTLDLFKSGSQYKYFCRVEEETNNIKEVKMVPDFDFVTQENVIMSGISPIAKMFMNNMIKLTNDDKYCKAIENSLVYILNNSKIYNYEKLVFDIKGVIIDPQPKLSNKNVILMINSENEERPEIQIQCNISNITRNNYILHCKGNETFKGQLQSAISFVDDKEILVLNFADINDSFISIENPQSYKKDYLKNHSDSLGAGAIAGIIISIIVVLALVIFLIFFLIKKNKKIIHDLDQSSIKQLDSSKN